MADQSRELAERFNRQMRDVILLLRRVSMDQPITVQQLAVLGSLQSGSRRMSELAAEHGVRLPTMTMQINRLVRDGLVTRGADAADARVVTVSITPVGAETLRTARAQRIDFLADRFAALSEDERAAIATALPAFDKLCADSEESSR
ncbi:MarR family transcriptional regulator [Actinomadura sp. HBU206391]|nr:MarR family transcriptional regulator [Actinomadura sp. HBU206391]